MNLKDCSRSQLEYLIDEWVINVRNAKRNREILKLAMFDGISQEKIAEEYGMSTRQVQNAIKDSMDILLEHL